MTWIETRLADLEDWRQRNATIREYAPAVYDSLWSRIFEHVEEARTKGLEVSAGGHARKRTVKLAKQNNSGDSFEFELALVDSKLKIRAKGDRVDITFDLNLCPENVVCMFLGEGTVSVDEAAILILDPFLFPQLQRQ